MDEAEFRRRTAGWPRDNRGQIRATKIVGFDVLPGADGQHAILHLDIVMDGVHEEAVRAGTRKPDGYQFMISTGDAVELSAALRRGASIRLAK
jgi:hypothetical protein